MQSIFLKSLAVFIILVFIVSDFVSQNPKPLVGLYVAICFGLVGFAWKRRIWMNGIWKVLFAVLALFEIAFMLSIFGIGVRESAELLFAEIPFYVVIMHWLAILCSTVLLYVYAYRSPEIWSEKSE